MRNQASMFGSERGPGTNNNGDFLNSAIKEFQTWERDNPGAKLVEKEEQLIKLYKDFNLATLKGSPWTLLYMNTILKDRSLRLWQAVSRLAKCQESPSWKHYSRQERLTYLKEFTEMYRLDYQEWLLLNRAASGALPTGLMELVKLERRITSVNYKELMVRSLEQARKIGKSDLVVGITFFNETGTLPGVIQIITEGIRKYYPDKKVVIITVGDRKNGIEANGVDNWITSEAIVRKMKMGESFLTAKIRYSSEDKHSKLFKQVASTLFDQIIRNSPWWISRSTDQIKKDQRVALFNKINKVYPTTSLF